MNLLKQAILMAGLSLSRMRNSGKSISIILTFGLIIGFRPLAFGQISFSEHNFGTHSEEVYAVDIDGDGDVDVLSAGGYEDNIKWYKNDGLGNFTEALSEYEDSPQSVFAIDMDGDGDVDILASSEHDDLITWHENNGSNSFSTERTVLSGSYANGARGIHAADMDNDGDMDVVSANNYADYVVYSRNNGNGTFSSTYIDSGQNGAHSVYTIDLDNDGDTDFIASTVFDEGVKWYENDGSGVFTDHYISSNAGQMGGIHAADVDNDGDIDVLSASWSNGGNIRWYKNNGSESFTSHTIDGNPGSAESVYAVDIDEDGDMDVLSASDEVNVYENDGTENFTKTTVSDTNSNSVHAADFNGDGLIDILSASGSTVKWFQQLSRSTEIENFTIPDQQGATVIDNVNHAIHIHKSKESELSSLIATFELSAGATATVSGLAQVSGTTANDFSNTLTFTVTAEDGLVIQDWTINIINVDTDILSFSIPGELRPATIDTENHSVEFFVEESKDLTNLIASFTLSEGATASVGGVTQNTGVTTNDFTSPVTYTITSEDGLNTQDWTVSAHLLNEDTDFESFSVFSESRPAEIDAANHSVEFYVDDNIDLSTLTSYFALSTGATATVNSTNQQSGATVNDFSAPVTYTITAEDGLTTQDWLIGRGSKLPSAWIGTEDSISYTFDKIAIGADTALYELDVHGAVSADEILHNGTPMQSAHWIRDESDSTLSYTNGFVGIGTTIPTTELDVNGTVNAQTITINGSALQPAQWDLAAGLLLKEANWDAAYAERGSQIAGNNLTWENGMLNVDLSDSSANWNAAYTERGSAIAGAGLIWNDTSNELELDPAVAGTSLTLTNGVLDVDLNSANYFTQDVSNNLQYSSGKVLIGDTIPNLGINYMLAVGGTMLVKQIKVRSSWADFVFEEDYKMRSLGEVENFIDKNGHLPDIPSASEVKENGVNLGEMDSKLLQKIEELTLYMIELKKKSDEQDKIINKQSSMIDELTDLLEKMQGQ